MVPYIHLTLVLSRVGPMDTRNEHLSQDHPNNIVTPQKRSKGGGGPLTKKEHHQQYVARKKGNLRFEQRVNLDDHFVIGDGVNGNGKRVTTGYGENSQSWIIPVAKPYNNKYN